MSNEDQLQALLVRHCASIKDEIAAINRKLDEARQRADPSGGVMRETLELVHRINGSSGSLGFLDLSSAAARLEDILKTMIEAPCLPEQFAFADVFDLFADVKAIAERTSPENSSLFGFDLNRLSTARAS